MTKLLYYVIIPLSALLTAIILSIHRSNWFPTLFSGINDEITSITCRILRNKFLRKIKDKLL